MPEKMRGEVKSVRKSTQTPEHAIFNLYSHAKSELRFKEWDGIPTEKSDPLETRMIAILQKSKDPVVRTMLLIGLGSSQTEAARDAVVAATADPHPGMRAAACSQIECLAHTIFGPGGSIGVATETERVKQVGRIIRTMYRWDKTLGAGWGRVHGGLQTRLAVRETKFPVGKPVPMSMLVRNVSGEPIELPGKSAHPVHHVRVLRRERPPIERPRSPDPQLKAFSLPWRKDPLSKDAAPIKQAYGAQIIEPGMEITLAEFNLDDYYDLSVPGYYDVITHETLGLPPPPSNRVYLSVYPAEDSDQENTPQD